MLHNYYNYNTIQIVRFCSYITDVDFVCKKMPLASQKANEAIAILKDNVDKKCITRVEVLRDILYDELLPQLRLLSSYCGHAKRDYNYLIATM